MNWFDRYMQEERAKAVKAEAERLTMAEFMALPIRERIRRSLSGDITIKGLKNES